MRWEQHFLLQENAMPNIFLVFLRRQQSTTQSRRYSHTLLGMYEGLSDQSIALKNGVGDIAAMAKSSFVHTPKIKDIIWNVDYDIL